jgi:hypothetical protein
MHTGGDVSCQCLSIAALYARRPDGRNLYAVPKEPNICRKLLHWHWHSVQYGVH